MPNSSDQIIENKTGESEIQTKPLEVYMTLKSNPQAQYSSNRYPIQKKESKPESEPEKKRRVGRISIKSNDYTSQM